MPIGPRGCTRVQRDWLDLSVRCCADGHRWRWRAIGSSTAGPPPTMDGGGVERIPRTTPRALLLRFVCTGRARGAALARAGAPQWVSKTSPFLAARTAPERADQPNFYCPIVPGEKCKSRSSTSHPLASCAKASVYVLRSWFARDGGGCVVHGQEGARKSRAKVWIAK